MSQTITEFEVRDIRFPTSQRLDGPDATDQDCSAPHDRRYGPVRQVRHAVAEARS